MPTVSQYTDIGLEALTAQPQQAAEPQSRRRIVTLPNALTLAGAAAGTAWLAGASGWWALLGLAIDEVDGRLARSTGDVTDIGGELDFATDVTLNGAVMMRLGTPVLYALPAVVAGQAFFHSRRELRPSFGSPRMVTTLYALYREGFFKPLRGMLGAAP